MPALADGRFAAFLLYESDAALDEAAILDSIARRARDFGAEFEVFAASEARLNDRRMTGTFHRRPERVPLDIRVSTVRLTVTVRSGPGDRTFWERFVDPALWPDAFDAIGRERAHVTVVERGDVEGEDGLDAAYDRALATTIAAQAVALVDDPLAVLWHPARNALSAELFMRALRPLGSRRSPIELWASLRPIAGSDGATGILTEGLLPLIGREIEVPPSAARIGAMVRAAIDFARYLLDEGGKIGDGGAFDDSRNCRLTVHERPCVARPGIPAFQISMGASPG